MKVIIERMYMDSFVNQIEQQAKIIEAKDILILLLTKQADDLAISIVEEHIAVIEQELEDSRHGSKS